MRNGNIFQNKTNFSENGIALQISLMPGLIESNQTPPSPLICFCIKSLVTSHIMEPLEAPLDTLVGTRVRGTGIILWCSDENCWDLWGPRSGVYTLHLRVERSLSEQSETTRGRSSQGDRPFSPLGRKTLGLISASLLQPSLLSFCRIFLVFFFHFPSLFPNLYSLLLPYQLFWDLKQFKSWNFTLEIKLLRILHFSVYWDLTAGLMASISVHLDPVFVFSVAPYTLFLLNYYFWHLEYIFILS